MAYKPSEQPVSKGMFSTSHAKTPLLMDTQLHQSTPRPSVPKNVSLTETAKAKANKFNITASIKNDCDNAEMTNAPKG